MKKSSMELISTFIVKHIFFLRFKVAQLTKKSKICKKIIKKLLFDKDETYFIPNNNSITKEEIININKEIPQNQEEIILPSNILKEVIKKADDIVIMNTCLCRISTNCKNYPQDLGCIFLGKATHKISRDFCKEATKEEAIKHVDKCTKAGLTHIIGRNKLDSIWMNARPKEELLTICNCCPCCCLWNVLPNLDEDISNKFFKLPGIEIRYDPEKCINCKKCLDNCFTKAITYTNNQITINNKICKGCGRCATTCPTESIKISYNDKSINNIIERIDNLVKK